MGEGSDSKEQLGRILLRRNAVTPEALRELLAKQEAGDDVRLANLAADAGTVDSAELLSALSEQRGSAAVDLRRVVVSLGQLRLVPREVAERYGVLPLTIDGDLLFVATADPHDRSRLDGLARETGKDVVPYLALAGDLEAARRDAYARAEAGAAFYRGPLAPPAEGKERPSLVPAAGGRLEGGGVIASLGDDLSRPLSFDPIDLPAHGGGSERPRAGEERRRRVLVVDDSDDIRRLLVRVLRERDFEVFESANGLDALEQVRENPPDVLVLDAMLPEVHGFDICRRIKGSRRYGHIPIVMVSAIYRGWRFAEDLRSAYGVDAFLEKPFRIGDMLAAVEEALDGKRSGSSPSDPDQVEGPAGTHLEAGIEAYANGDVTAAIDHLRQGIDADPQAFRLHYHLGLLYGKQNSVFEAIQSLETAAGLRPRDFSTLKNLAVLYQRAGFRLKATEMWERALSAAPDEDVRANIKKHLVSLL